MNEIRTLRLPEMIVQQKGSIVRRFVHLVISVALRLFFYRIQISNAAIVPAQVPLIFILNHPNGLIDPALVFCGLPRRVSFLAKATLFDLPVIGWLLRTVEALPLYRRIDQNQDIENNQRTFAACRELLQRERCIALFPEGVSHRAPALQPLKTGAARIALGALSASNANKHSLEKLLIVPVGIYYSARTPFRGEALLQFGEPLEITAARREADGEPNREDVRALTDRMTEALRAVTLNFTDVEEAAAVAKAEALVSSGYRSIHLQRSLLEEFSTRMQIVLGRRLKKLQMPGRLAHLENRLQRYKENLKALGIAPEYLQISRHSRRELWGLVWRSLFLFFLFPFAFAGLIMHAPAYVLCEIVAYFFRTHGPDEGRATAKILAGIMLMPFTWLLIAIGIFFWQNWEIALLSIPIIALCGYVGLRWVEEAYDLRGWIRALFILFQRRKEFLQLEREGRKLRKELGG